MLLLACRKDILCDVVCHLNMALPSTHFPIYLHAADSSYPALIASVAEEK